MSFIFFKPNKENYGTINNQKYNQEMISIYGYNLINIQNSHSFKALNAKKTITVGIVKNEVIPLKEAKIMKNNSHQQIGGKTVIIAVLYSKCSA